MIMRHYRIRPFLILASASFLACVAGELPLDDSGDEDVNNEVDVEPGEEHQELVDDASFRLESRIEQEPSQAYYLCVDACDEKVSCWRACTQSGKVTNCLKAGFSCSTSKYQ